jgi:hypothetical protein
MITVDYALGDFGKGDGFTITFQLTVESPGNLANWAELTWRRKKPLSGDSHILLIRVGETLSEKCPV